MNTAHPAKPPVYPQLDALRGLGCLAVMWIHGGWQAGQLSAAGRQAIAATHTNWLMMHTGQAALEMFFAMSAFLLWRPFTLVAQTGVGRESVGGYALRRVARIIPAYWAALVLIALWQHTPDVLSYPGGLPYFLLGQNLATGTTLGGIGPAWTLAVEMQFYVLLAVAAVFRSRAGQGVRFDLMFAGGLALLAAGWRLGVMGPTDHLTRDHLQLVFSLPSHADSFAFGILLAALSVRSELRPGLAWAGFLRARAGAVFFGGIALFVLGVLALRLHSPFDLTRAQWLGRAWLYAVLAGVLIAPFAFAPDARGIVHRLLARPTLVKLGRWSFGAYLWHLAIWGGLAAAGMRIETVSAFLMWLAAGITLSFAVGAASWVVIERPTIRWAARRTARRHAPAATPAGRNAGAVLEPAGVAAAAPHTTLPLPRPEPARATS
jgi:peptidoglycan/LPS O-acetylase OafA/YrhL